MHLTPPSRHIVMAECVSPPPRRARRSRRSLSVWILLAASLLVVIALHGAAEASWNPLERQTEILVGTLANQVLEQVIGQGLFLLTAAVAVIVGIPLLLAWLALAASAIAFR